MAILVKVILSPVTPVPQPRAISLVIGSVCGRFPPLPVPVRLRGSYHERQRGLSRHPIPCFGPQQDSFRFVAGHVNAGSSDTISHSHCVASCGFDVTVAKAWSAVTAYHSVMSMMAVSLLRVIHSRTP